MRRTFDRNPAVHRRLKPDRYHPQRGLDVWKLRRAIRNRADDLGLHVNLNPRGTANPHMIDVGRRVAELLGMPMKHPGLTLRMQEVIRDPSKRTRSQKQRAQQRQPSARDRAVSEALRYARMGITEKPAGSNSGPHISDWQRQTARGATYLDKAPWCGIFCENVCRDVGVATIPQWAGVGLIEDYARQGQGGFVRYAPGFTTGCRPGDLVILFGRGVHVELIVAVHAWGYETVGGNTSSGPGGSQSNGGGVFKRDRPAGDVHGVAIVDY